MGVYIKDMEMPKNCTECKIKGEGSDSLYTWSCPFTGFEYTRYECLNGRLDDCPLIEVPNPHGRLIDADVFKETIDYYIREANWSDAHNEALGWAKEFIDNEQTIIEAEGSEDENNNV